MHLDFRKSKDQKAQCIFKFFVPESRFRTQLLPWCTQPFLRLRCNQHHEESKSWMGSSFLIKQGVKEWGMVTSGGNSSTAGFHAS